MEIKSVKLIIGVVVYGDAALKYLPSFLPSLFTSEFPDFKVLARDNNEDQDNESSRYIQKHFPQIEITWSGGNIGFARAYNKLIKRAQAYGAEYFLCLNSDLILEPGAIQKMVDILDNDSSLASIAPKILKWDFEKSKKTNIIDSCGIKEKPGLRFFDIGQGEIDKGQYDKTEILGPSGAGAIYRMSALEKVKFNQEYFDELMFMYKEDCDLAYRFKLAGFKSKLASDAVVYHDRTGAGKGEGNLQVALNRKNKNRRIKEWSFLNQLIIISKYWHIQNLKNKLAIIWYLIRANGYALIMEPYLFRQYTALFKIMPEIKSWQAEIKNLKAKK